MSYATIEDMRQRYSYSTLCDLASSKIDYDDDNQPTKTPDEVINAALADASAVVDGYIDGRTSLPLKMVPKALVRIVCTIARHLLEDVAVTERPAKDYEGAIRFLEQVATGAISLGLSTTEERPDSGDIAIIESAGSVWGRNRSKGFI